jgi:anti-sigma factor RsiW
MPVPAAKEAGMLRCRDVTERASDLLDGSLSLRARLALRFHLAMCSMCRTYLDQMRKTRRLLAHSRFDPPDRATEEALIARITGSTDKG